MIKHTALIVDDDSNNSKLLKIYLKRHCPYIEVVGVANSVNEAILLYEKSKPELLYLDVCLGDEDSFNIIDSLEDFKGEVIFISAFHEYAIKAIKYDVVDFIIKPIEINDLIAATNKAILKISKHKEKKVEDTLNKTIIKFIAIPSIDKIELIKVDKIIYCESEGRYTIFHIMDCKKTKVTSRNLGEYEKLLNNNYFFRIHNKYLVNLDMVSNINKSAGNYCELVNNKSLPIAKRRQEKLHRFLNLK